MVTGPVMVTPFASLAITEVVTVTAVAPTVPEMVPLVDSVKPAGRTAPPAKAQVYGATPLEAVRAAL